MEAPLLAGESTTDPKTVRLGFVAGVIQQEKLIPFERLLFRATRGNMFLKSTAVGSVLDPTSGEKQEKAVFVVFFAGERARTKILKVGFSLLSKYSTVCTCLCVTYRPVASVIVIVKHCICIKQCVRRYVSSVYLLSHEFIINNSSL